VPRWPTIHQGPVGRPRGRRRGPCAPARRATDHATAKTVTLPFARRRRIRRKVHDGRPQGLCVNAQLYDICPLRTTPSRHERTRARLMVLPDSSSNHADVQESAPDSEGARSASAFQFAGVNNVRNATARSVDRSANPSLDASPRWSGHARQELITLPDAHPIDRSGFPSLDASPDRRDHATRELITLPRS